jgi:hypothetical protein
VTVRQKGVIPAHQQPRFDEILVRAVPSSCGANACT